MYYGLFSNEIVWLILSVHKSHFLKKVKATVSDIHKMVVKRVKYYAILKYSGGVLAYNISKMV